jgi:hypothetical protein
MFKGPLNELLFLPEICVKLEMKSEAIYSSISSLNWYLSFNNPDQESRKNLDHFCHYLCKLE